MDITEIADRAQRITSVRTDATTDRAAIETALGDVARLRSWLAAANADLVTALSALVAFPDAAISECTRNSNRDTARDTERARTLTALPAIAAALDVGDVTAAHVDEITRAARRLDAQQRQTLLDRIDRSLVPIAIVATVSQWRKRLSSEVRSISRSDGMEQLERQRRATSLRSWTDDDGMWCINGRFDPVTGIKLAARLDQAVDGLFADSTPSTAPDDPLERQHHLRALAFAELVQGTAKTGRSGRPEFVVVIDTSTTGDTSHRQDGPVIDWGIPIEIPHRILAELADDAAVHPIVIRNGVVLHAPGTLDLGRTTRLANRAQRRALRALHPTCAIPGCTIGFNHCKIHHITWWRHGGHTDLDNLIPVCTRHHTDIHTHHWNLTLHPDRRLSVTYPDGSTRTSRPPPDRTAA